MYCISPCDIKAYVSVVRLLTIEVSVLTDIGGQ